MKVASKPLASQDPRVVDLERKLGEKFWFRELSYLGEVLYLVNGASLKGTLVVFLDEMLLISASEPPRVERRCFLYDDCQCQLAGEARMIITSSTGLRLELEYLADLFVLLSAVIAAAVRPPWVADSPIRYCKCCGISFSLFIRRHHCRRCGTVYCGVCTRTKANFLDERQNHRICRSCYAYFVAARAEDANGFEELKAFLIDLSKESSIVSLVRPLMLVVCEFLNIPGTWNKDALVEIRDPRVTDTDLQYRKNANQPTNRCPCLLE